MKKISLIGSFLLLAASGILSIFHFLPPEPDRTRPEYDLESHNAPSKDSSFSDNDGSNGKDKSDRFTSGNSNRRFISHEIDSSSFSKEAHDGLSVLHFDHTGRKWYFCKRTKDAQRNLNFTQSKKFGKTEHYRTNDLSFKVTRHDLSKSNDSVLCSGSFEDRPNLVLLRGNAKGFIALFGGIAKRRCWERILCIDSEGIELMDVNILPWLSETKNGGDPRSDLTECFFSNSLSLLVIVKKPILKSSERVTFEGYSPLFLSISRGGATSEEVLSDFPVWNEAEPEFISSIINLHKTLSIPTRVNVSDLLEREDIPLSLLLQVAKVQKPLGDTYTQLKMRLLDSLSSATQKDILEALKVIPKVFKDDANQFFLKILEARTNKAFEYIWKNRTKFLEEYRGNEAGDNGEDALLSFACRVGIQWRIKGIALEILLNRYRVLKIDRTQSVVTWRPPDWMLSRVENLLSELTSTDDIDQFEWAIRVLSQIHKSKVALHTMKRLLSTNSAYVKKQVVILDTLDKPQMVDFKDIVILKLQEGEEPVARAADRALYRMRAKEELDVKRKLIESGHRAEPAYFPELSAKTIINQTNSDFGESCIHALQRLSPLKWTMEPIILVLKGSKDTEMTIEVEDSLRSSGPNKWSKKELIRILRKIARQFNKSFLSIETLEVDPILHDIFSPPTVNHKAEALFTYFLDSLRNIQRLKTYFDTYLKGTGSSTHLSIKEDQRKRFSATLEEIERNLDGGWKDFIRQLKEGQ